MLTPFEESCRFLSDKMRGNKYPIAIILGSGLGGLVDEIEIEESIPYGEIPNFPVSTVEGHSGRLIFGKFGGKRVMAMQGRFHYYEGYSMQQVTYPIRVMKLLGVETLMVSNAAGGINPSYAAGDLMLITDHLNFLPEHPLRGHNLDDFGERFPPMVDAYSPRLIARAEAIAQSLQIAVQKGVYVALQGPTYETPAEYRFVRLVGADAVGMSTVPEIIVARHCGIECFGISVITNAAHDSTAMEKTCHTEVQEVGELAAPRMTAIFRELVKTL